MVTRGGAQILDEGGGREIEPRLQERARQVQVYVLPGSRIVESFYSQLAYSRRRSRDCMIRALSPSREQAVEMRSLCNDAMRGARQRRGRRGSEAREVICSSFGKVMDLSPPLPLKQTED